MIKDLLPLYIDGLTSDTTNREIEEHVSTCEACNTVLESMKKDEAGGISASEKESQKKQIDFLKKYRRRLRITALSIILAILVVILGVLFSKSFLIGEKSEDGQVTYTIEVRGNEVYVTAVPSGSKDAISELSFEESSDGFLWIQSRTVKSSPIHRGEKSSVHTWSSDEPLQMIFVGENRRIVWDSGDTVSLQTWNVWGTKHFESDGSDESTAKALGLKENIGDFTIEPTSGSKQNSMLITFSEPLDKKLEKYYRTEMRNSAYKLMALISNLEKVSFRYKIEGEEFEDVYSSEDASRIFGQDIKNCFASPKLYQDLERILSVAE